MKLLVVEDDELQRKIVEHWLLCAGYEVTTAASGEEALAKVVEGDVQILITDWDMPGKVDGTVLCRQIRAAGLAGYLYILMLTGHTAVSDIVTALEAGADDYIRKPADEAELLARVKAGRRIVELERRTQLLSITDPLCGCYNRRYLNEQLPREVERSRRYDTQLALVMADIDHFKAINDIHGHLAGDEALRCFTARTSHAVRESVDWIARYGGEEFVLILPETDEAGARAVAEKVRRLCADAAFETTYGAFRVTASLGVATLSPAADVKTAMADLLARADSALFRSKRDGRNRVT